MQEVPQQKETLKGTVIECADGTYGVTLDTEENVITVDKDLGRLLKVLIKLQAHLDKRKETSQQADDGFLQNLYLNTNCHKTLLFALGLLDVQELKTDYFLYEHEVKEIIHPLRFKEHENVAGLREQIRKESLNNEKFPLIGRMEVFDEEGYCWFSHSFAVLGFDNKGRCLCAEKAGFGSRENDTPTKRLPWHIVEIEEIFNLWEWFKEENKRRKNKHTYTLKWGFESVDYVDTNQSYLSNRPGK